MVLTMQKDWLLSKVREELEERRPEGEEKNFTKKYGFKIPENQPHSNDTQYFMCEDLELYVLSLLFTIVVTVFYSGKHLCMYILICKKGTYPRYYLRTESRKYCEWYGHCYNVISHSFVAR